MHVYVQILVYMYLATSIIIDIWKTNKNDAQFYILFINSKINKYMHAYVLVYYK